jgi:hypothetical protein
MAVAGGVAGGMLLDRMLHNHGNGNDVAAGDAGGAAFNPAATELESRPVDFGTGGNDWDAGGSSDVGSSDGGGSDGGGGWD